MPQHRPPATFAGCDWILRAKQPWISPLSPTGLTEEELRAKRLARDNQRAAKRAAQLAAQRAVCNALCGMVEAQQLDSYLWSDDGEGESYRGLTEANCKANSKWGPKAWSFVQALCSLLADLAARREQEEACGRQFWQQLVVEEFHKGSPLMLASQAWWPAVVAHFSGA